MTSQNILIIDDEPSIRDVVHDVLEDEGYKVFTAANADAANAIYEEHQLDAILLDIWMPDTDGITLLKSWADTGLKAPVVMISGHGTVDTAVEAVRHGAYDFLEKPLSTARLLVTIKRALQSHQLETENKRLKSQLEPISELIGKSASMMQLREQIQRAANSDSRVLISGEQGSGKGVAVRLLHEMSSRKQGPFIDVRLGAIPPHSVDSQLFGREEKNGVQAGRFEHAHNGTLFLDEIGDISLEVQNKLLNTLVEGQFLRQNGQNPVPFDARVISATKINLEKMVSSGKFRDDLFYRLNVIPISIPPLREHKEDIPDLIHYWVDKMVEQENLAFRIFTTSAINIMRNYDWPGNVRELKNLIQRLLILNRGEEVSRSEVEFALGSGGLRESHSVIPDSLFEGTLKEARDRFEYQFLSHHLQNLQGNMGDFAKMLGLERTHLYRKLKSLGIDPKKRKTDNAEDL